MEEILSKRKNITIVSVDGLMGAGKSTLLDYISKYDDNSSIIIYKENLDKWREDENLLKLYYDDPKRYSTIFQINVLTTKIMDIIDIIKNNDNKIIIIERSPLLDKEFFAKIRKDFGYISNSEWNVYENIYNLYELLGVINPDFMVYLKTSPKIAFNRVKNRNRNEEDGLKLDYLEEMYSKHEEILYRKNNVLVYDVSDEVENLSELYCPLIEILMDRIKKMILNI